ncbi:iron-containing alcohol dehydrogenase [Suttonella ornithocola]|uniref:Alcohol dehydrogenase YqhD n=1 Tax=Suttonella ornithocola TaxID=279832 RepID=A0A380N204_9GAMM|nr:iron-containing alcohol dehydrogenase [Suttonella ornithocola]SUO97797.1 Alcohol dehydrogenase YqhD [Suttonella ornithocola]
MNFEYYNPTRIVFGEGKIAELNRLVPADAKVMVLYGGGSAERNGTLAEVREALGNRVVVEFGGIEPNPEYETLLRAVAEVQAHKVDFLLAVGGGSVIDGTKFIAAAAEIEEDPWQILLKRGANIQRALPLATVLTIPATGSEMNSGGVITRWEKKAKLSFGNPLLYPKFSILDPQKTLTLPERQMVNGVVDAFVHVIEQYLTYPSGAQVQDAYAEALLRILIEDAPKLLAEPKNMMLRENIMWAATMALNGLIGAGAVQDWSVHAIGHELTALYGIDHARTLALVLPGLWKVRREAKAEKLLQYATNVWQLRDGSEDERIDQAIANTEDFFNALGVGTRLSDYQLDAQVADTVAMQLTEHGLTKLGEHGDITPDVAREILLTRV